MWRTTMSQSFPMTSICKFRRRCCGEQISTVEPNTRKGFTTASMLYQALFTAPNVGILKLSISLDTIFSKIYFPIFPSNNLYRITVFRFLSEAIMFTTNLPAFRKF